MLVTYMVSNDNKNNNKLVNSILANTEIKNISYINEYDNYYLVIDNDYLYVINNEYKIILKKEKYLIYENKENYDIIYKNDTLMYFNDYIDKKKLVYEYYDIYTYELIDRVFVGGYDE